MYPSINICNNNSNNNNFIYNNTPIPTSPIQYEDEHVLLQHIHSLLLQQEEQQHNNFDIVTGPVTESPITKPASSPVAPKGCKKDRHSKIHTAHGPRDRRMRLSLDVARKFFDLQDMLGFDKASKTVDWLMMKSRVAINELKNQGGGGSTLSSTTSECEAVSGVVDQEFEPPMGMDNSNNNNNNNNNVKLCEKKAKGPGRVRPALFNPLAKESRNKARERARERTQMKKNLLGETRAEARPKAGACLPENSDHADATAVAKELTTSSSHIHEHSWSGGLSTIFHSHENEFGYYTYSGKYWEGYSNGN